MIRACTVAVAVAGLPAAALADEPPGNAATWYQQAIELRDALDDTQWAAVIDFAANPVDPPPPGLRAIVEQAAPMIELYRKGAAAPESDFGLEYSKGPHLTLPHLTRMRDLTRLMVADASVRLANGDSEGAAAALAAACRASSHLGADQTIISSLVGYSMFQWADTAIGRALDSASLDPESGAILVEAMASMPGGDPFNMTGGVFGERDIFVGWMLEEYSGADAFQRFMDEMGPMGGFDETALERLAPLNSPEHFQFALEQTDEATAKFGEIFLIEDDDVRMFEAQRMEEAIMRGDYGPIAAMMLPAYGRLTAFLVDSRDAVASRLATLERLVEGRMTPEELANAATWYLRAIKMIDDLAASDDEATRNRFVTLRRVGESPAAAMPEDLAPAFEALEPILATLAEGAKFKRCDFSIAGQLQPAVLPAYVGGMREAVRLVHADALRLHAAGRLRAALDRLALAWRMANHLGDDPTLVSSLAAGQMAVDTTSLALTWLPETPADPRALRDAVNATRRSDPFGLVASTAAERKTTGAWVIDRASAYERPARDWVDRLRPPQIVYVTTIAQARRVVSDEERRTDERTARRLQDVLDTRALNRVRNEANAAYRAITGGAFERVNVANGRAIADVEKRSIAAHEALARLLEVIPPPPPEAMP